MYTAPQASHNYILTQLRRNDNENYISNLLQPRCIRLAHAALRVFNVELASIRGQVSNEDLGRMRLAHFRSSFEAIKSLRVDNDHSAIIPATPVMECLAEAITRFPNAPWHLLERLLDARERDLQYPNYESLESLEQLGRDTQGVLMRIHAGLLGDTTTGDDESEISQLGDICGSAVGLCIVLRGVPAHAVSRMCYMPRELVREHKVSSDGLLTGSEDARVVYMLVASRASEVLNDGRRGIEGIDKAVRPAFWGIAMGGEYLRRLQRANGKVFDEGLQTGLRMTYPLVLQLRLLAMRYFGGVW